MALLQLLLPVVMVHQRHHQVATVLHPHQAVTVLLLHPVVTVLHPHQAVTVLRLHPVATALHPHQAATVLRLLGQVVTALHRHLVVMVLRQDGRRIFDYGGPSGNMIWILGNR
jgi:hypothetical protein